MEELPKLVRLNISGNGFSEVNTDHVRNLQQLNCSDNSLKVLSVIEGPLKELTARNNSMNSNYVVQSMVYVCRGVYQLYHGISCVLELYAYVNHGLNILNEVTKKSFS